MVYLPKGSIMLWWDAAQVPPRYVSITEHNRQPLAVTVERIENVQRMANGTLRKYVIADKRKWSTSWDSLPDVTSATVDNKEGGLYIENFYGTTHGAFTLKIMEDAVTGAEYTVVITEFSKTIKKRGRVAEYDVSITLEEV